MTLNKEHSKFGFYSVSFFIMSMENSASGSKDVDYDEETKITSGVSQKNISRKANGRNPSNVAESKDRDRENPPSPLQKEVEKEESGAPKSRRKRNEVSNSSVSSGGGWMSTSSGISNGTIIYKSIELHFNIIQLN